MGAPDPEADDLFIYAPSYLTALDEGTLYTQENAVNESKVFGSQAYWAKMLSADTASMLDDTPEHKRARHTGTTVGKRILDRVKASTGAETRSILRAYLRGSIDSAAFRERMEKTMRVAWRNVFLAGYRASGRPGTGKTGNQIVTLEDKATVDLLRTAISHEMRFLNKFMADVVAEQGRMDYEQRLGMYIRALESFYDNARVMGLPPNVAIHWVGPHDRKTCASCRYLFTHSPYTKTTLPTVPRAGQTLCLTNCRDKLLIRHVPWHEMRALEQKGDVDRYLRRLRIIKRAGR